MERHEQIIEVLLDRSAPVSGNVLAETLGISRTAVWKAIRKLIRMGYGIEAEPRRGYRVVRTPDLLFPALIRRHSDTRILARDIRYFDSLHSTNLTAKEAAIEGARDGALVVAESQTGGRGRLNRTWLSPKGANLLFSMVLRPNIPPQRVFRLNMTASVSIVEAVRDLTSLDPGIKWPNDVYLGPRKLAGLLTEFSVAGEAVEYVVVGIGLNVNMDPEEYPEIRNVATSVRAEVGHTVSRLELLGKILSRMDVWYDRLIRGEDHGLKALWNSYSTVIGRQVEVRSADQALLGRALTIDDEGALILEDESGMQHRVLCGDLSLRLKA
ncbi:MAG: biotin--[acetyl-CoA-carboxylase] ligase [Deltaproteobacteria bacterium]|nr:biotin--[acetyl-CoA-carboxylase] ligase [Deltaproteobacteria bacterium]